MKIRISPIKTSHPNEPEVNKIMGQYWDLEWDCDFLPRTGDAMFFPDIDELESYTFSVDYIAWAHSLGEVEITIYLMEET